MAWQDRGALPVPGQQPQQDSGFNFGDFALNLLPGGSLISKGLKGEQITGGDVALEAGLSLVPFGLGKVAKGAKALVGGSKAINKLGKATEKIGGKVLASQSLMTGAGARQAGVTPVRTMGNLSKRTGLTNLEDMAEVSRSLTGGKDSLLDVLTRSAVGEAKGIKLPNMKQLAENMIDDYAPLLTDAQRKRLMNEVTRSGVAVRGGAKGSLSPLADPQKTLDMANSFRSSSQTIKGAFNASPAEKQLSKVYDNLASSIEKSIYGTKGVGKSVPMLTKEGANDLLYKAKDLRAAGNVAQAKAYEKIAKELFEIKDIKSLRSFKRDFVDLGKIDKATGIAEGARGLNTGDLSGRMNLLQAAGSAAAPSVGGALVKAGSKMAAATPSVSKGFSIPGMLASQAGVRMGADALGLRDNSLEGALTQSDLNPLSTRSSMTPSMNNQNMSQNMDSQYTNQPQMSNPLGVSSEQIGQALMRAYMAGDQQAAAQLQSMLELASQFESSVETEPLSQSNQSALASAANADNTLSQLEELYTSAGGGSGRIGGFVQNLAGQAGFDKNANIYNSLAEASVTQIAKALAGAGGGTVSDMDAKVIIAALPTLQDSPEEAKAKFTALRQRLQVAKENTMYYGQGGTSLENTLTNQGAF
jgi:hypothetical protein